MNYYETMYIINSSLEGDEIQHIKKDVLDYMISEGADIYSKSDWGRTRLAYDIEKQRYGNYIILRFSSKPELIKTLNEKFGLMDAVLSHLCIVLDKEPERIDEETKAHDEKVYEKPQTSDGKTEKKENVKEKADKKEEVAKEKTEEVAEEKADKKEKVAKEKTEEVAEEESEEAGEEKAAEEENVAEKDEKDEIEEEVKEVLEEKEEPA